MTAPLTGPDCDLRDFSFMPIEIDRLFNSEFHAFSEAEAWRAGVTLWLKSYHQVPAASIPDNDIALTRLAELGRDVKAWLEIKDAALRGWILCDDGRLYHPVVAEKALEAWIAKLEHRKRSAAGNAKKHNRTFDPAPFDALIEEAQGRLAALALSLKSLGKRGNGGAGPPEAPFGQPEDLPSLPQGSLKESIRLPQGSLEAPLAVARDRDRDRDREESPPLPPPVPLHPEGEGEKIFEKFWQAMPSPTPAAKARAKVEFTKLGAADREAAIAGAAAYGEEFRRKPTSHPKSPVNFLVERCFDGYASRGPPGAAKVRVVRDTPQGDAWDAYRRAHGQARIWGNRDDWYFDSEWPPGPDPPAFPRLVAVGA